MKIIQFLLRLFFFWLLFFLLQQLVFVILGYHSYLGGSSLELLKSFWIGLRMNIATLFYIIAIPILMVIAGIWGLPERIINAVIKWETIIFLALSCLLCAVDIGIYKSWGTKFNAKALVYMTYPKDVIPLLYEKETFYLFPILIVEFLLFNFLRKKWVADFNNLQFSFVQKGLWTVLLIVTTITGVRGGLQKLPLNRNQIFYSEHQLLNYAAMNSIWNFGELVSHPFEPIQNPYPFFPQSTADALFNEFLTVNKDSTEKVFTTDRPNIVLVFLESWTADVVECIGGEKGVAPKYGTLAEEGLLFSNFYSTGYRTEQGLLSMLSAFPAQPKGTVMYSWGKFDKLPNIYRELKDNGYSTSFYYGGRLQFDNVEAYLHSAGVDRMVGENDFPIKKRTVWGAYDEEIFNLHLTEMKTLKQPFFSVLGTISTHEWWDSNVNQLFHHPGEDQLNDKFRNTVHYADSCLFDYIKRAQKESWYNNTIFILVADHGSKFPKQRHNFEVARHHIPMLITGGALKSEYRGKVDDRVASHTDLAATILGQLNIKSNQFPRSKNLFNPLNPAYAYYTFENGFGIITKEKTVIYDIYQNMDRANSTPDKLSENLLKYGKAYLQCTNSYVVGENKK